MMRPEPGVGFKLDGLIYNYLSGWTDYDKSVVNVLSSCFDRKMPSSIRDESVLVLVAWADAGLPERRYLP